MHAAAIDAVGGAPFDPPAGAGTLPTNASGI